MKQAEPHFLERMAAEIREGFEAMAAAAAPGPVSIEFVEITRYKEEVRPGKGMTEYWRHDSRAVVTVSVEPRGVPAFKEGFKVGPPGTAVLSTTVNHFKGMVTEQIRREAFKALRKSQLREAHAPQLIGKMCAEVPSAGPAFRDFERRQAQAAADALGSFLSSPDYEAAWRAKREEEWREIAMKELAGISRRVPRMFIEKLLDEIMVGEIMDG